MAVLVFEQSLMSVTLLLMFTDLCRTTNATGCVDSTSDPLCGQDCVSCNGTRMCSNVTSCQKGCYGRPTACQQCGNCANNTLCNETSGECPLGCEDDYYPPFCQARISTIVTVLAVVWSAIFLIEITLAVLTIFECLRRRQRSSECEGHDLMLLTKTAPNIGQGEALTMTPCENPNFIKDSEDCNLKSIMKDTPTPLKVKFFKKKIPSLHVYEDVGTPVLENYCNVEIASHEQRHTGHEAQDLPYCNVESASQGQRHTDHEAQDLPYCNVESASQGQRHTGHEAQTSPYCNCRISSSQCHIDLDSQAWSDQTSYLHATALPESETDDYDLSGDLGSCGPLYENR